MLVLPHLECERDAVAAERALDPDLGGVGVHGLVRHRIHVLQLRESGHAHATVDAQTRRNSHLRSGSGSGMSCKRQESSVAESKPRRLTIERADRGCPSVRSDSVRGVDDRMTVGESSVMRCEKIAGSTS